jgi:hypothetical protein
MKPTLLSALLFATLPAQARDTKADPRSEALRFAPTPGEYLRIVSSERETDTEVPKTAPGRDADPEERLRAMSAPKKQTVTARRIAYDWRIQDRDADGNTVIEASYAFIQVTTTFGKVVRPTPRISQPMEVVNPGATIVMDTRVDLPASNPALNALKQKPVDQQPPGLAELMATLEWGRNTLNRSLIARPFTMVVSPEGKLLAVRGMDVIMDQYRVEMNTRKTEPEVRARQDAWIETFFGEDTFSKTATASLLLPYPGKPVVAGESWSDAFEFEVSGMKLAAKRTMRLDGATSADGSVPLSGVLEVQLRKEGMVFDPPDASLRLTASVDAATGMYRQLTSEGSFAISVRAKDAAAGIAPLSRVDLQLFSSTQVTRLARRDPDNKKLWVFDGPDGLYQLRMGTDWVPDKRSEEPGPLRDLLKNMRKYNQTGTQAQLISDVSPRSADDEAQSPLSAKAAVLKSTIEKDGKSKATLSWSRLFDSGSVHWMRCRIEIKQTGGEQETYWGQVGYGTHKYSFDLSQPGPPSPASDAEATAILDSIVSR